MHSHGVQSREDCIALPCLLYVLDPKADLLVSTGLMPCAAGKLELFVDIKVVELYNVEVFTFRGEENLSWESYQTL